MFRTYMLVLLSVLLVASVGCAEPENRSKYGTRKSVEQFDPSAAFKEPSSIAAIRAACAGDRQEFDRWMNSGVDVNQRGERGITPLIWVLQCNRRAGVKMILDAGGDPNAIWTGYRDGSIGLHPVNAASRIPDSASLELILQAGGNPDGSGNRYASRPLLKAVILGNQKGYWKNYETLLRYGADQNKSGGGGTAVGMLASLNHWDKVAIAIENGYNFELPSIALRHQGVDLELINESRHAGYYRAEAILRDKGFDFPIDVNDYYPCDNDLCRLVRED